MVVARWEGEGWREGIRNGRKIAMRARGERWEIQVWLGEYVAPVLSSPPPPLTPHPTPASITSLPAPSARLSRVEALLGSLSRLVLAPAVVAACFDLDRCILPAAPSVPCADYALSPTLASLAAASAAVVAATTASSPAAEVSLPTTSTTVLPLAPKQAETAAVGTTAFDAILLRQLARHRSAHLGGPLYPLLVTCCGVSSSATVRQLAASLLQKVGIALNFFARQGEGGSTVVCDRVAAGGRPRSD